jgi:hypothetical protein
MQYQHLNAWHWRAEPASVCDAQGTLGHCGVVVCSRASTIYMALGAYCEYCIVDLYTCYALTLLPHAPAAHSTALSRLCAEVLHLLLMRCFEKCTAQQ